MLAISIPALKGLAAAMGVSYQKAIQEVVVDRKTELDDLHQHWMIGQRHNAEVSGKDDLLRAIARENLGLENWEQVAFV